jgi:5'-nucleotidase
VKLILTNDDGYGAPGLNALLAATEGLGDRITVAPHQAHSGCSHKVTTDEPIIVKEHAQDTFVVVGTPADCVRVAFYKISPDASWVLSGINAGGNLGVDVFHSGTVAAAREAVIHGRPGIAVSHYKKRGIDFDWAQAAAWTRPLLLDILSKPAQPGMLWNINLPHLAPGSPKPNVIVCPLDPAPLPLSFRSESDRLHYDGVYQNRARSDGTDVFHCLGDSITVTEIRLY